MLKDITYEEFKGNSAKIKRRIRKELKATTAFNPKRKKCYRKLEVRMNTLGDLSKDEFIEKVNGWFDAAAKSTKCPIKTIRTEQMKYGAGIVFYGHRPETDVEVEERLVKAINQNYEKFRRKFATQLKKEKEIAAREAKKKREAKRQAVKIIETLGEDVYEVFDEIIKKKS